MKLNNFSLPSSILPTHLNELREEVRSFLASELGNGGYQRDAAGWDRYDPKFSLKIAKQGWIGMTWPKQYGGKEKSFLERYVVAEELLSAGAPVRAHWLADRQIGPLLLSVGTEDQKIKYLPKIAAGECFFCVGLSEPDSGSDLSSIRTKAIKVDGGWNIQGSKLWTSYAHMAHMINLFARTSPATDTNRHFGVTQFLVNLQTPGITIKPIVNLAADHDFNEVVFDDVFVSDHAIIGKLNGAWGQVTGELAHERSGSERWLNAYGLLINLIDSLGPNVSDQDAEKIGHLIAHIWTLHRMSFSISWMLEKGESPDVEAAIVKDLGTHFDQKVPLIARQIFSERKKAYLDPSNSIHQMLKRAQLYSPSHTIRGGTQEILRGIIARGLGLR